MLDPVIRCCFYCFYKKIQGASPGASSSRSCFVYPSSIPPLPPFDRLQAMLLPPRFRTRSPPNMIFVAPVYEQIPSLCCDPGVPFFKLFSTIFEPIPPLCCDPGCFFFAVFHLFWSQSPRYAAILAACFFRNFATCFGTNPLGMLRSRLLVLPFFRSRIDRREQRFVLPFSRSRMYRREQQIMHFPSPPQPGPDPWHMPGPGGMRVALTINNH